MRNLLHLTAATAGLLLGGCGGGEKYTITAVDVIKVKIANPKTGTRDRFIGTLWRDGESVGTRYIHTTTDRAGVKQVCTVEIERSQLRINGKGYGAVTEGDIVEIDGDAVKVNGAQRVASPPG